jgi:hypothetical protein
MATRKEIIATFDPSGVGLDNGNLYGLPFDYDSAQIIIFACPGKPLCPTTQAPPTVPTRCCKLRPNWISTILTTLTGGAGHLLPVFGRLGAAPQ